MQDEYKLKTYIIFINNEQIMSPYNKEDITRVYQKIGVSGTVYFFFLRLELLNTMAL